MAEAIGTIAGGATGGLLLTGYPIEALIVAVIGGGLIGFIEGFRARAAR